MSMEKFEFTKPELEETEVILNHLRDTINDTLKPDDELRLREQLMKAIEEGHIGMYSG